MNFLAIPGICKVGICFAAVLTLVSCSSGDSATSPMQGETAGSTPSGSTSIVYDSLVDSRDGKVYKTVVIGSQTWMAENLNYDAANGGFCYAYNNNCSNAHGRYYSWAVAVGKSEDICGYGRTCSLPSGNIQGVCPEGWHLPSQTEWNTLFTAVGGSSIAGKKLKSKSNWCNDGNGTDDFGFSAEAEASYNGFTGDFSTSLCFDAHFWSSTEIDSGFAYGISLYSTVSDPFIINNNVDDSAHLGDSYKNSGFSVRCVKD